jgi:hypothetical protein
MGNIGSHVTLPRSGAHIKQGSECRPMVVNPEVGGSSLFLVRDLLVGGLVNADSHELVNDAANCVLAERGLLRPGLRERSAVFLFSATILHSPQWHAHLVDCAFPSATS